jgi:hypothetical protein
LVKAFRQLKDSPPLYHCIRVSSRISPPFIHAIAIDLLLVSIDTPEWSGYELIAGFLPIVHHLYVAATFGIKYLDVSNVLNSEVSKSEDRSLRRLSTVLEWGYLRYILCSNTIR